MILFAPHARYGKQEIFNSDQGGQLTSPHFVDVLLNAGTKLRTGLGNWIGNCNADRPLSSFGGAPPDEP